MWFFFSKEKFIMYMSCLKCTLLLKSVFLQKLAPTWDALAKSLEYDTTVTVAKVDCTAHRTVCNTFDIKGYPTLLWIEDGKKVS